MKRNVRYECSIVIPTYNRLDQLAQCLQFVQNLKYPRKKFEVIVVDDGSDVSLKPIIGSFEKKINLTLIRQENSGPAAARNTGARHARGRYLAFIDDDCTPEQDWLSTLTLCLSAHPDCMAGGHTVNKLSQNIYTTTSQLIIDWVYAYYNDDFNHARFLSCNNIIVGADDFNAIGGFDPAFRTSEDRDLCDRWILSGRRMIYVPEAVSHHAHFLTGSTFWKMYVSYGRGAWYYSRAYKRRHNGQSTLGLNFYRALVRRLPDVLTGWPASTAGKILVLLFIWQIANAVGFYTAALKIRPVLN